MSKNQDLYDQTVAFVSINEKSVSTLTTNQAPAITLLGDNPLQLSQVGAVNAFVTGGSSSSIAGQQFATIQELLQAEIDATPNASSYVITPSWVQPHSSNIYPNARYTTATINSSTGSYIKGVTIYYHLIGGLGYCANFTRPSHPENYKRWFSPEQLMDWIVSIYESEGNTGVEYIIPPAFLPPTGSGTLWDTLPYKDVTVSTTGIPNFAVVRMYESPADSTLPAEYQDPGAIALDAEDGNLPVTVGGDIVDTATVGTYNVTYSATDNGGLTTIETRQVDVISANTAPAITLLGNNPDIVEQGSDLIFPVGMYRLSMNSLANGLNRWKGLSLRDASDNVIPPVSASSSLQLLDLGAGSSDDLLTVMGTAFMDFGVNDSVTSADQIDFDFTVDSAFNNIAISDGNGLPPPTIPGSQLYKWDGTAYVLVAANVNQDATYNDGYGGYSMTKVASGYQDPGATAIDAEDGDISGDIIVGGDTVDISTEGTYTRYYDVTDSGGNSAPQVTRIINVEPLDF